MDIVRFGIIGIGNMGTTHSKYLFGGEIEGATITAICDLKQSRLDWAKEQFGDKVGDILSKEKSLAGAMKTMLGINPAVHLVPPKTIARSEGQAVRVVDKRKLI